MSAGTYIVRAMTRGEIGLAVDWAAAEGWNPGLHDADSFYAADTGGFLVGDLDGEPIASISAVQYGATFGFVGFYIVKPGYRGHGYGGRIWQAGLQRLAGRTVGLDGVVAQQENYKKSGFRLAYRNIRYAGVCGRRSPAGPGIVDLSKVPFTVIADYDRPFFPDVRDDFLKAWLRQPGSIGLGLLQNGMLTGYGVIRPCRTGFKIGPLFADGAAAADALFTALTTCCTPGQPVYLDVPETNREAVALAARHGLQPVFETARMYTGPFPELPFGRLFGVTSFELG